MSQTSIRQKTTQDSNLVDNTQIWRMRWFFAILLALLLCASIAVPIVVFCVTKSPYSFSLFSFVAPPSYFLYRFLRFLLPLSKDELTLEAKRIERDAEKYRAINTETSHKPSLQLLHVLDKMPSVRGPDE